MGRLRYLDGRGGVPILRAGAEEGEQMSRSSRKFPRIGVTTATSEKQWKQLESRRRRKKLKLSTDAVAFKRGNDCDGPKDGKRWIRADEPHLMRK
jgi:hypothetical protein